MPYFVAGNAPLDSEYHFTKKYPLNCCPRAGANVVFSVSEKREVFTRVDPGLLGRFGFNRRRLCLVQADGGYGRSAGH
jgi:hypothetical protein